MNRRTPIAVILLGSIVMIGLMLWPRERPVTVPVDPPREPAPTLVVPLSVALAEETEARLPMVVDRVQGPEALSQEVIRQARFAAWKSVMARLTERRAEIVELLHDRQQPVIPGVETVGLPGKGMLGNSRVWVWTELGEFPDLAALEAEARRLKP